jgi:hypothetical protein
MDLHSLLQGQIIIITIIIIIIIIGGGGGGAGSGGGSMKVKISLKIGHCANNSSENLQSMIIHTTI